MNYVGIDYHKKYSVVTAVDETGYVIRTTRLDNKHEPLQAFFSSLGGPSEAVLEATRTWGVLYDLLEEIDGVDSVTLAHSLKVRAIAEAQIKTDTIDSHTLAQLLRADLIPTAYIPGKETRSFKEMIRQRLFLARMRTRLKNRIHVLLDRRHVPPPPVNDVFGKGGIVYLKKLQLPGIDGEILRENLKLLEVFDALIKDAEREISSLLGNDPRVTLLRSIPGLGPILAVVVALEIDNIARFGAAPKLAAYTGLVPSTYASGGKTFHGHLLHMSNKWLRWAFVEAAWVAMRSSPYCRAYFESRKRHKGPHVAIIALARRLSEIVWYVLNEQGRMRNAQSRSIGKRRLPPLLSQSLSLRGSLTRIESGGSNSYNVWLSATEKRLIHIFTLGSDLEGKLLSKKLAPFLQKSDCAILSAGSQQSLPAGMSSFPGPNMEAHEKDIDRQSPVRQPRQVRDDTQEGGRQGVRC